MKLNKIHHIAMIVSDYEKSKKFYTEQLGFQILRENYREDRGDYKLDLKQGDCELRYFQEKDILKGRLIRKHADSDISRFMLKILGRQ